MKQAFTLPENAELELLKNMLEEAGIRCALMNQEISQTLPLAPFHVQLWVENDDDVPRAQELCHAWLNPPPGAKGAWACANCGQGLQGQFDSCWRCGTTRAATDKLKRERRDDENASRFVD
jgi:Putative prokaryotic signal transducing protein